MYFARSLVILIISITVLSSAQAQQAPSNNPLGKLYGPLGKTVAEPEVIGKPKSRLPVRNRSTERDTKGARETAWLRAASIEKVARWMADRIVTCDTTNDYASIRPYILGRQLAETSLAGIAKDKDSLNRFLGSGGSEQLELIADETMIGLIKVSGPRSTYPPVYEISNVRRQSANRATVDIERLDRSGYQHRTLQIYRDRKSVGIADVKAPTVHLSAKSYLRYYMIAKADTIPGIGEVISDSHLLQSPDVARILAILDASSEKQLLETFHSQYELMSPGARNWRITTFYRCMLSLNAARSSEAHTHFTQMQQTVTDPDSKAWASLRYGIHAGDTDITERSLASWQQRHRPTQMQWLELARLAAGERDKQLAKRWLAKVEPPTFHQVPAILVGCEIALRTGDHPQLASYLDQLDREFDLQLYLDPGSDDWEAFEQSDAWQRHRQVLARRWSDLPSYQRGVSLTNVHQMARFAAARADKSNEPPELVQPIETEAVTAWIESFQQALQEGDRESLSRLIAWDVALQREITQLSQSRRLTRECLADVDVTNHIDKLNDRLLGYSGLKLVAVQAPYGLMEVVYRVTDPDLDYLIIRLSPSRDGVVATEISSFHEFDSICRAEADSILWPSLWLKSMRGKLTKRQTKAYRYLKQRQRASLPASQRKGFDVTVNGLPAWDVGDPVILRQAISESKHPTEKLTWMRAYMRLHDVPYLLSWLVVREPELVKDIAVIDSSLRLVQSRLGGDTYLNLVLASSMVDMDARKLAEHYAESIDTKNLDIAEAYEMRMKVMIAVGKFAKAAEDYAALEAKGLHGEALHRVSGVPRLDDFLNSPAFKKVSRRQRGDDKKWNETRRPIHDL